MSASDYPYFYFGVNASTEKVELALEKADNEDVDALSVKTLAGVSVVVGKSMDNATKTAAMKACKDAGLKVIS